MPGPAGESSLGGCWEGGELGAICPSVSVWLGLGDAELVQGVARSATRRTSQVSGSRAVGAGPSTGQAPKANNAASELWSSHPVRRITAHSPVGPHRFPRLKCSTVSWRSRLISAVSRCTKRSLSLRDILAILPATARRELPGTAPIFEALNYDGDGSAVPITSNKSLRAAWANMTMFEARSSSPVRIVAVRCTRPTTATQACPGGSPYRLPVGPAAPVEFVETVLRGPDVELLLEDFAVAGR